MQMKFLNVLLLTHSHLCVFVQNGNPQNPYCTGIEGVMEAYYQSLKSVRLYGPTHFSPVINHVARYVHYKYTEGCETCGLTCVNVIKHHVTKNCAAQQERFLKD